MSAISADGITKSARQLFSPPIESVYETGQAAKPDSDHLLDIIVTPKHLPAYICSHVFRNEKPILLVAHNRNGDWQFLCGDGHADGDLPKVVGVGHLLDRDPSLEKLHDLPLGWSAERQDVQSEWRLCRDKDDA